MTISPQVKLGRLGEIHLEAGLVSRRLLGFQPVDHLSKRVADLGLQPSLLTPALSFKEVQGRTSQGPETLASPPTWRILDYVWASGSQ